MRARRAYVLLTACICRQSKLVYTHPDGTHVRSDQLRKVKKDNRRPVIKEEDR